MVTHIFYYITQHFVIFPHGFEAFKLTSTVYPSHQTKIFTDQNDTARLMCFNSPPKTRHQDHGTIHFCTDSGTGALEQIWHDTPHYLHPSAATLDQCSLTQHWNCPGLAAMSGGGEPWEEGSAPCCAALKHPQPCRVSPSPVLVPHTAVLSALLSFIPSLYHSAAPGSPMLSLYWSCLPGH